MSYQKTKKYFFDIIDKGEQNGLAGIRSKWAESFCGLIAYKIISDGVDLTVND